MWPNGSFRIEQWRIVEELQVLVVSRHQCGCLGLSNLLFHLLLLGLAQSRDVTSVYPAGVAGLELGEQTHVLVVGRDVHLAQDALLLLLLERVLHLEVRRIGRIRWRRGAESKLGQSAYFVNFYGLEHRLIRTWCWDDIVIDTLTGHESLAEKIEPHSRHDDNSRAFPENLNLTTVNVTLTTENYNNNLCFEGVLFWKSSPFPASKHASPY